ncbi:hypothetical protein BJ742DRAFT_473118 [Cladochytrium replicatum]|nr:hypothetical protein BJ742DRAFT_473118 [Cladochytrium replicatum]
MSRSSSNRLPILIVLDLNGTLIDRIDKRGRRMVTSSKSAPLKPDCVIRKTYVYLRPYLDTFLDSIFSRFHVAGWTSAIQRNAQPLAEFIFGDRVSRLEFLWDRSMCDQPDKESKNDFSTVKDLSKVWSDPNVNKSVKWTHVGLQPSKTQSFCLTSFASTSTIL